MKSKNKYKGEIKFERLPFLNWVFPMPPGPPIRWISLKELRKKYPK